MSYQRILLLNRIHIGDCLFTTPAIRAIREAYPDAWIVAAVPRANADLLSSNPCIDEIIWRPVRSWWGKFSFIRDVRRRRFDLVVSFQEKSIFYGLTTRCSRARQSVSLEHWRTHRFYRHTVPWPHELHRVDRYLTLVSAVGAFGPVEETELHVQDAAREGATVLLREHGVRETDCLVGLNPGSTEVERRWPPDRLAAVGDRLAAEAGARIVLFGSGGDRAATAEIAAKMRAPVIDLAGRTRLQESAAVLERCSLFVSGDTGPLHMAAAVGTPVVALFGPSHPHLAAPRFGAGGGESRILQHAHSCGVCPGPCLHTITAEECVAAALELLGSPAAPMGLNRDERADAPYEPHDLQGRSGSVHPRSPLSAARG